MTPETKYTKADKLAAVAKTALAFACLASPSVAQDDESKSPYQLDTYITVANRLEMPLDRVGSSVEYLSQFDLEKTNQSFLLDAIRLTPGFNVRNNGGPGASFGITTRGLNANRPVVLIDGIEVSDPATGSIINFGNLFTSNLSRVEILKGPQSSLYGADAVAGVINLQTRAEEGGELNLGYGSFDTYQGSIAYGSSNGPISYSVNLSHFETEGFSNQRPSFGPAWADDDAYENTTASARIDLQASESVELYLFAYYNENFSEFDPGNPAFAGSDPFVDNYTEGEQLFAKAGAKLHASETWTSQIDFGYTDIVTSRNSSFPSTDESNRVQIDWQNAVEANENWSVVAGLEYEKEEDADLDQKRDETSLYIENVLSLNDQFDLTLGARYDDNEDYGSETTYRSTFNYRIAEGATRIHGSYGSSFQAPSFFQLDGAPGAFGNPDLKAESGDGWDFGIETAFAANSLFFSSTIFGYDIDDKIAFDFTLATTERPFGNYSNAEKYTSEGIETIFQWYPQDNFDLKFAHTYADAEYGNGTEAERVPRNTYSLSANWNTLKQKLNLNANVVHVSSQFSLRGDANKQSGYTVVNLAASYELSESYSLWSRIDNLFDDDYEEILTYQTPGFSLYGGVRLNF
ncbi:MAG: TonB-dependent receptor [Verrucomicrobiota bacterium]